MVSEIIPSPQKIGALIIGQTPRPDLVDPLRTALKGAEILAAGALDELSVTDLPPVKSATYPLTTRLRDGSVVTIPESFLIPLLQRRLEELEDQGVIGSILLCAGTFGPLEGRRPLIKPFAATRTVLESMGLRRLGLIVPDRRQERPVEDRWRAAGFVPVVWTDNLGRQGPAFRATLLTAIEANDLELIVIDYVGHPAGQVAALRKICPRPVVDLGALAIRLAGSIFSRSTEIDGGLVLTNSGI